MGENANAAKNICERQSPQSIGNASENSQLDSLSLQKQQEALKQKAAEIAAAEKIRYKTEFCRNALEKGYCQFGDFCHFAHNDDELRPRSLDPKYKTSKCRSYHGSNGICYYAKRCDYIHGESAEELMRIRRYNQLYAKYGGYYTKSTNPPSYRELEEMASMHENGVLRSSAGGSLSSCSVV